MITYKLGNLIEAAQTGEVDVIAHCCNCFCTMGSGIAPQIKKAFPEAYEVDCETVKGSDYKLGSYSVATHKIANTGNELKIFNLYGQFGYWGRSEGKIDIDYYALSCAMKQMSDLLPANSKIGLPLLGAGLSGGDWGIIYGLIVNTLSSKHDVTIFSWKVEELCAALDSLILEVFLSVNITKETGDQLSLSLQGMN